MSKGKRIGYIRVSTYMQNPERQLDDIVLDKKFTDYASAASTNRPELTALLDYVREDDTVIVHSMDRLARNVKDLRNVVDELIAKKVKIQFIKENLSFDGEGSAMSNLILTLFGAFAEFERAFIRERQKEGIAIAIRSGKFKGGKKKLNPEKIEILKRELEEGRKSKGRIARELGIGREGLYPYIRELEKQLQRSFIKEVPKCLKK
jgi:DNA invertase Pin-like site-specific DNA recombinase